ncbi:arylsulfatase [Poritiphilus flavus]|uniref:Sulfatase-like hydrolase/transferase n=1 Tax=Poritiphilus flavus TaxID=2697053 RepID=A0A6L9ED62_9FLAO|nr:arylsulfatase [Poritiphilus flavus]NAS12329.1 sulfatase-like hydrolase/transferase [Poritiphilus flavus]
MVFKKVDTHIYKLLFLSILIASEMGCQQTQEARVDRKPNIVLIMADDQGWGDLSIQGNSNLSTPNIDALAKNGASFENFYVQPVCSPTRAELLTGRYFTRLGIYDTSAGGERLNLGETTIAEVFRNSGYATAAYGKWHNGMQPPYHPNARGFDDFYGFASGHWGNYFEPFLEHNGHPVKGKGFLVDDLTEKGMSFIEQNRENPFFLYLPYNTPHSPMQVPDEYWKKFESRELGMRYRDSTRENINFTRAALAMVENIDYNIGRLMEKIRQAGLEENTIVIYLSDNGPNGWRWNGGMRGKKGSTDEGGVRTPFFIQWKDSISAGKSIADIASAIDILPTLADLAGLDIKTAEPPDGKSLAPLIFEEDVNWDERYVYNHWNGRTSIRSQEFRLDHEDRLYDMSQDPGQTLDVSDDNPGVFENLKLVKAKWLAQTAPPSRDSESRPFTLGYPGFELTQLPARDGQGHGNIQRSNKYPNCSFFTNWKSATDFISWEVDVLSAGEYEVTLYYSCKPENTGATISLSMGENQVSKKIKEAHDPPLKGMEHDRDPRIESYVKDFKPLVLGTINLDKTSGRLRLDASDIPGAEAIDVRLLLFKKLD